MKVLISSRSFGKIDSGAIELLKKEGLEPVLNPYGRKLNEQELLDLSDDVVGIIAGTEKITEKIIVSNNQLKVISRYGIGLDNVDLKAATQKNVMVYNTPETPSLAVAELTLSLILNLRRFAKCSHPLISSSRIPLNSSSSNLFKLLPSKSLNFPQ